MQEEMKEVEVEVEEEAVVQDQEEVLIQGNIIVN